jgi:hypothetical protein
LLAVPDEIGLGNELDTSVSSLVLGDALPYGLSMLEQTFIRLSVPQPDRCTTDALIESFCIHARQLIDFFENQQALRASEFTGGTYLAQHVHSIPASTRKKLDQVLTQFRSADENEPIGFEERAQLVLEVAAEARNFMSRLSESDRAHLQSKYRSAVARQPVFNKSTSSDLDR